MIESLIINYKHISRQSLEFEKNKIRCHKMTKNMLRKFVLNRYLILVVFVDISIYINIICT